MFGCIQSLRNHLRGVNTGSNFNSISLKNHKGNIIIWIVKFFLEIGSITGCCSCCWIRPFCGDEYGLIDHWSGIFSYKNMSITVQLQFDSRSKNSWIKNMILLMQGCCCFCCYSNPADFEAFLFLSFCIEEFVDTREPRTWSLFVHFVFLLVRSIEYCCCRHQSTVDLTSSSSFLVRSIRYCCGMQKKIPMSRSIETGARRKTGGFAALQSMADQPNLGISLSLSLSPFSASNLRFCALFLCAVSMTFLSSFFSFCCRSSSSSAQSAFEWL